MILNNVTKFHKILIKTIQLREPTSLGVTYVPMGRRTYGTDGHGVTLNAPAIVMAQRHDKNKVLTSFKKIGNIFRTKIY